MPYLGYLATQAPYCLGDLVVTPSSPSIHPAQRPERPATLIAGLLATHAAHGDDDSGDHLGVLLQRRVIADPGPPLPRHLAMTAGLIPADADRLPQRIPGQRDLELQRLILIRDSGNLEAALPGQLHRQRPQPGPGRMHSTRQQLAEPLQPPAVIRRPGQDQPADLHRASPPGLPVAGLVPPGTVPSSRHSSAASWVITAYKPLVLFSRQASNVRPRQLGRMLNENAGNAVTSRTSSARIHSGAPARPNTSDRRINPNPRPSQQSCPPPPDWPPAAAVPSSAVMSRAGWRICPSPGSLVRNAGRIRPGPGSRPRPPRPAGTGEISSRDRGRPGSCRAWHLYYACRHDPPQVVTNPLHMGFSPRSEEHTS